MSKYLLISFFFQEIKYNNYLTINVGDKNFVYTDILTQNVIKLTVKGEMEYDLFSKAGQIYICITKIILPYLTVQKAIFFIWILKISYNSDYPE